MAAAQAENTVPDYNEPHGHAEPTPHHAVPYWTIFGVLVVLTVITVGVTWLPIESALIDILVALTIATIKAACVALFFMHLKFEGKLIYLILIVPLILTVILVMALLPDVVYGDMFNPGPAVDPAVPAATE